MMANVAARRAIEIFMIFPFFLQAE